MVNVKGVKASSLRWQALVMLVVWGVALAAVAGWAYRRDEGRRFS